MLHNGELTDNRFQICIEIVVPSPGEGKGGSSRKKEAGRGEWGCSGSTLLQ